MNNGNLVFKSFFDEAQMDVDGRCDERGTVYVGTGEWDDLFVDEDDLENYHAQGTTVIVSTDMKDDKDLEIERLESSVVQLRRAYADLFNRVSFAERRVENNENYIKVKQAEDIQREIDLASRTHTTGTELVPYAGDLPKLPVKYSDKTFPFVALPMMHTTIFFKNLSRRMMSYIVPLDASPEGTRAALQEAEHERQLINIARLHRRINKFQRLLAKAIRKNKDSLVEVVGDYTTDNMIMAYALREHFISVGYNQVTVTANQDKIFLHVEIVY